MVAIASRFVPSFRCINFENKNTNKHERKYKFTENLQNIRWKEVDSNLHVYISLIQLILYWVVINTYICMITFILTGNSPLSLHD